jgi:uncharacterized protein YcbX
MAAGGAHVRQLARFPVKACAADLLDVADVGVAGLRNDRVLAVVAGDRIVTQRGAPVLARVTPVLDDASGRLTLSLAGSPALAPVQEVVRTDGRTREVRLFNEYVAVVDQAPALSAWFSEVLGRPAQLVAAPESTRRTSPGAVTGQTVLSDEGTVSLHSVGSLTRLNEALAARGHPAVPADRFRANVVIDGCGPHAEDDAERFEVGEVLLRFAQLDPRCSVTSVDQATGLRTGPEPLRTLAGYRRGPSGGVRFGVYAAVARPGVMRVGDRVLLERPR